MLFRTTCTQPFSIRRRILSSSHLKIKNRCTVGYFLLYLVERLFSHQLNRKRGEERTNSDGMKCRKRSDGGSLPRQKRSSRVALVKTGNDVIEKGEETATPHANGSNPRFPVMTKLCVRKDLMASYLHWELYVCSGLGLQAATSVILRPARYQFQV